MYKYTFVGDSHVVSSFGDIGTPCVYIGPRTAFKAYEHHKDIEEKIRDKSKEYIFCLGEIDCRIHIYLKADGDYDKIIEGCKNTVESYINYIQKLNSSGWKIGVLSIMPPGDIENQWNYDSYGTIVDRRHITEICNSMLYFFCNKANIKFFNLYPKLINKDGYRREDLILDDAHLNKKVARIFNETFLGIKF